MSYTPIQAIKSRIGAALSSELGKRSVAIMDRIGGLQDALSAFRDDIAVNMGAAEHARRTNDNTRDELRALNDLVMVLHRQVQRLQTDLRTLKGEP